ncbi:MAG: histidine kinase, partial [Deltaproteobacteria bacterium]|nr:histidine kinase [Deltaproteobacteria bacterium]
PVLEPTDITKLLHEIIEFAGNHSDLSQIDIVQNLTADIPKFLTDMDQLRQVTINLVLNAAAASSAGGEIRVTTTLDADQYVCIEFADDGEGISEENLERIFEPFFTTKTRGTGLGLAITKQIIDMHQGEIYIDSQLGKGTTVTIRLPLVREEY